MKDIIAIINRRALLKDLTEKGKRVSGGFEVPVTRILKVVGKYGILEDTDGRITTIEFIPDCVARLLGEKKKVL